jgi:pSer/pThr/pTyr-binding forkhead associated (FHA) protein
MAMHPTIKLKMTHGAFPDKEFVFGDRTLLTVGRAPDCYLRLPNDLANGMVSRHHCVFDIDPPEIRVRDLGSRNGTFVNGRLIGQRDPEQPPADTITSDQPDHPLREGDEVRIGNTVLRVEVVPAGSPEAAAQQPESFPESSASGIRPEPVAGRGGG